MLACLLALLFCVVLCQDSWNCCYLVVADAFLKQNENDEIEKRKMIGVVVVVWRSVTPGKHHCC